MKNLLEKLKNQKEIVFLFFVLIYGFILRVIYLDFNPMWIDENISSLAARGILEFGYPILESGESYFRAYIFHYIQAFFMLFVGNDDFGARFISVIFGVLTIFLAYLIAKESENISIRYFFPLLVCVFSYEIFYSKQARMYQMFQFLYFLSFYLFYRFITKRFIVYIKIKVSVKFELKLVKICCKYATNLNYN